MQPDVTFVIAAYHAEATIGRAIESALAQRGVTVEVVVVDDKSSDRTVEVARAFPAERVKVIALDKNRGPGGARNAGIDAARGRWVAILDSDDTVRPDRSRRLINRAETSGAQIAVDNLEMVQDGVQPRPMFATDRLARFPRLTLADVIAADMMFSAAPSFGYMKPMFERVFLASHELRYDETLRIGEDYVLLASALAKGGRCVVEPDALYVYHVHPGSISRVLESRHVEAMLAADAAFARDNVLDNAAQRAQALRTRSLRQAASFVSLVGHLKNGELIKASGVALRDPLALRHLRMPLAVRLTPLAARFSQRKQISAPAST